MGPPKWSFSFWFPFKTTKSGYPQKNTPPSLGSSLLQLWRFLRGLSLVSRSKNAAVPLQQMMSSLITTATETYNRFWTPEQPGSPIFVAALGGHFFKSTTPLAIRFWRGLYFPMFGRGVRHQLLIAKLRVCLLVDRNPVAYLLFFWSTVLQRAVAAGFHICLSFLTSW